MFLRFLFFIIFLVGFEYYAFQAVKTVTQNRLLWGVYVLSVLAVLGNLLYHSMTFDRANGFTPDMSFSVGLFLAVMVFQLTIVLLLFFEDLMRLPQAVFRFFTEGSLSENYLPSRRKFISQLALGLASVPFASILYGMYKGKYNYKVLSYTLTFDTLPKAFDGLKIAHISDIHSGSFDNAEKVNYGIDLVNAQNPDLILFTGDIVNNKAEELLPWKDSFSRLEASLGKFSVLGNHDYGDYTAWPSKAAKEKNMSTLFQYQKEMGFQLLLNQHHFIEKDGERLALVGVENWGKGGFKKAGDLQKAVGGVAAEDFKILMSHDPSHWEAEVLPHAFPFELTLSGHTHGMQFGIEIPGWVKWSPIKWRYKQWAGIYQEENQFINVNRGFGFLGYPGRVGMWPEISVITLKSSV